MASEPGPRPLGLEQRLRHRARVAERGPGTRGQRPETGRSCGSQCSPRRWGQRPEQNRRQLVPRLDERLHEPPVRRAVAAETVGGLGEPTLEHDRRPVVERVRRRCARVDPVDAEVEAPEERRPHRERLHRGADVVQEPGQRQLLGVQPTAEVAGGLPHLDLDPVLQERDRRREPVRPRPDHQGACHVRS